MLLKYHVHPPWVLAEFMHFYAPHTGGFVLVYWPEECLSVIASSCVSDDHTVGDMCEVTMQKKTYSGRIAATGMWVHVFMCVQNA